MSIAQKEVERGSVSLPPAATEVPRMPAEPAAGAKVTLYERFNIHQRLQHALIFTSFTLLAVTGLPMKYSTSGWAAAVAAVFGGWNGLHYAHLAGAIAMIIGSLYHLAYLFVAALRCQVSWAMLPTWKDVTDLFDNLRYFLGVLPRPARFHRYSYKEKFDYWAVFWGMFIMVGSGLMMWFPGIAAQYVPRWLMDAGRVAHSDEAMLAILAIFVWHFFNVHLNPKFFPANMVFYSGKVDREFMAEEHPEELAALRQQGLWAADGPDPAAAARDAGEESSAAMPSRFRRPKPLALILVEILLYLVIVVLFLRAFLPVGLR